MYPGENDYNDSANEKRLLNGVAHQMRNQSEQENNNTNKCIHSEENKKIWLGTNNDDDDDTNTKDHEKEEC